MLTISMGIIERLPTELVFLILQQNLSPSTSLALVQAIPLFYRAYRSKRSPLIRNWITGYLHSSNLELAIAVCNVVKFTKGWSASYGLCDRVVDRFDKGTCPHLNAWLSLYARFVSIAVGKKHSIIDDDDFSSSRKRVFDPKYEDVDLLESLWRLSATLEYFVRDMMSTFDSWPKKSSVYMSPHGINHSDDEYGRLQRALLHFELYCRLFRYSHPLEVNGSWYPTNDQTLFLGCLSDEEIAQLWSVHDYLERSSLVSWFTSHGSSCTKQNYSEPQMRRRGKFGSIMRLVHLQPRLQKPAKVSRYCRVELDRRMYYIELGLLHLHKAAKKGHREYLIRYHIHAYRPPLIKVIEDYAFRERGLPVYRGFSPHFQFRHRLNKPNAYTLQTSRDVFFDMTDYSSKARGDFFWDEKFV